VAAAEAGVASAEPSMAPTRGMATATLRTHGHD